jgi:hypothetical protein
MAVLGFGTAVSVAPLNNDVMASPGDRHSRVASGVKNAEKRVDGLLAVALLGAIDIGQFRSSLDERLKDARVSTEVREEMRAQASKLAEAQVPAGLADAERHGLTRLMDEAFADSFRVVMLTTAAMAMLSAICGWLAIPKDSPQARKTQPTAPARNRATDSR